MIVSIRTQAVKLHINFVYFKYSLRVNKKQFGGIFFVLKGKYASYCAKFEIGPTLSYEQTHALLAQKCWELLRPFARSLKDGNSSLTVNLSLNLYLYGNEDGFLLSFD